MAETTTTVDYSGAYRDLRERLTAVVRDRSDPELETIAPATPAWRVRDIVSHVGGVCDDIIHGNMDGVATEAWTGAHVDKRRDWPFDRVLDDWAEHAATVESMMNDIGAPMGQLVFDAWTHEQDVRGALRAPGGRDGAAIDIAWEWFVTTSQAPPPPLQPYPGDIVLATEAGEAHLGTGAGPIVTIRTSRFEFLRSVTGRRSVAQVRAFDHDGPLPEDVMFVTDLFRPATADIVE